MSAVISAHNLRTSYAGQIVVNGVNIAIHKGECFGPLGPNRAAKTARSLEMKGG